MAIPLQSGLKLKNKGSLLYKSLFKHLTVKVSEEVSNYYQ